MAFITDIIHLEIWAASKVLTVLSVQQLLDLVIHMIISILLTTIMISKAKNLMKRLKNFFLSNIFEIIIDFKFHS